MNYLNNILETFVSMIQIVMINANEYLWCIG